MLILDCDIASTLAKVDKIDLLSKVFSHSKIYITISVYTELIRAKRAGFSFPDKIFTNIPLITMNSDDLIFFQKFSQYNYIHFGEAEGVSICKNRGAIFLTNDSQVVKFCMKNNIKVLNLKDFLVLVAIKKIITFSEMNELIRQIEEKDNTFIKNKADILDEY